MPDGATYLDQFRILVSHIGNAMGYVRMIRSGGLRSVSESVAFVPELEGAPKFGDLCAAEGLSEESVKAGEMLDKVKVANDGKYFDSLSYMMEKLSCSTVLGGKMFKMFCKIISDLSTWPVLHAAAIL